MTDGLAFLNSFAHRLAEPENLFSGFRLPHGFALPDNILVFFHDFTASAPNTHGRHTLVFPLDPMTYYISRTQIDLTPGTMLYIEPYVMRFLHPGSQGFRRLFITFELEKQQNYLPKQGLYRLENETASALHTFLDSYGKSETPKLAALLTEFLSHVREDGFGVTQETMLPASVEQALRIIDNEITSVDGIKTLAARVGLSESHLRALFRHHVRYPIGEYITNKRLDLARYYLLKSEKPLAEIAALCGFSNIFVFSSFFKRNTGLPPTVFRRRAGTDR